MKILITVQTNISYPYWKVKNKVINSEVIQTNDDLETYNPYKLEKEIKNKLNYKPDEYSINVIVKSK